MAKSKDLFDDTTMSFGEHLEVLRIHLWKGVIGLVVCVCLSLFFGRHVVGFVRMPIDAALERNGITGKYVVDDLSAYTDGEAKPEPDAEKEEPSLQDLETIPVLIRVADLEQALHKYDPDRFPTRAEAPRPAPSPADPPADPPADGDPAAAADAAPEQPHIVIPLRSTYFAQLRAAVQKLQEPITLTVEEAFMTYLKVSLVAGLVLSAPWIFYQIWLFVAAGLYPHERRYVHIFLPLSLGLFLGGAIFCFFVVFPYVLDFLLGFNEWLGVTPQIRLSEWISFAVVLPVMFGVSFQLPLVMLFLERISVFDVRGYQDKRRLAIFVIAIISMFLTPADPMSMTMMMFPLVILYEAGIQMCRFAAQREGSPFPSEAA
ncbi:MAG TPA: twin-arginine translocase subunit TatC [Planctomycetaceae bacterium]|nr:twin-arginine translocase subunit TatC [Planctomycetaceae bacterium]